MPNMFTTLRERIEAEAEKRAGEVCETLRVSIETGEEIKSEDEERVFNNLIRQVPYEMSVKRGYPLGGPVVRDDDPNFLQINRFGFLDEDRAPILSRSSSLILGRGTTYLWFVSQKAMDTYESLKRERYYDS